MRKLIGAMICAAAMSLPAVAQTIEQRIATSLEAEGYRIVTQYRTLLGRIYVIAETDEIRREMVFNPATGEVLRDYAVTKGPERHFADDSGDDNDTAASGVATTATTDIDAASTTVMRGGDKKPKSGSGEGGTSMILVDPVIVSPSD